MWKSNGPSLPTDKRLEALDRLQDQRYSSVIVRGGEPMLADKELSAILEKAAELSLRSEVHSTGLLITKEKAQFLQRRNTRVVLTALAANKEDFEAAAHRPGSWEQFRRSIELLRSENVSFSLKVPLTIAVPDSAQSLANWAITLGASDIDYIAYAPLGKGYTVDDLRHVTAPSTPSDMAVGMEQFFKNVEFHSCFNNACFISADGIISPCIGYRKRIASLREASMTTVLHRDLINRSRIGTARRTMPTCAGCEFRYGCWACFARTEQVQKTVRSRHWNCMYDPEGMCWT